MRPTDYSEEKAIAICVRLANGEPLAKMCRAEGMPHASTVYRWLVANETFREMYARAREDQADTLADEIVEIADDGKRDTYIDEDGKEVTNQDVIARSRLRVEARKWIAAKLKPRKYGDRVDHELTGKDGGPIKFEKIVREVIG